MISVNVKIDKMEFRFDRIIRSSDKVKPKISNKKYV